MGEMDAKIFRTGWIPGSWFSQFIHPTVGMVAIGGACIVAGVSMRARVTTRHAHRDGRRSETSANGITFGHYSAGAKN